MQQLVEERLRVLQLTEFDHSLQELKNRMEKIDATTKQQKTAQHTLQVSPRMGPDQVLFSVPGYKISENILDSLSEGVDLANLLFL